METLKRLPALRNEWPMLLSNFFNRDAFNEGNQSFFNQNYITPAVNIRESAEAYAIELVAPGMTKNDFKIELDGSQLTITAEKADESESGDQHTYHRKEFSFQSVKRSFTLPEKVVDAEKITAEYKEGILYLNIPKKEEALPKPARMIQIS